MAPYTASGTVGINSDADAGNEGGVTLMATLSTPSMSVIGADDFLFIA